MFVTMLNSGGRGTDVSCDWDTNGPATIAARPRQGGVAVAGDLPTRRAGVRQLM